MIITINIPKRGQKITNGDLIKALFPQYKPYLMPSARIYRIDTGDTLLNFSVDWWNALYEVEKEVQDANNN